MLRVSTKPRKRNSPRIAEKSAPGFLQWLRGRECVWVVDQCGGKIEPQHLDFAGGKGIGTKVSDKSAVPSCGIHHARQHLKGWLTFLREQETTKDKLIAASEYYWRAWPGRVAWERKLSDG
jgi:hypothetical protein